MEADQIKKINKFLDTTISSLFDFIIIFINIILKIVIVFGALAALIILYKMFPDTALILIKPMMTVFGLLFKIIHILLVALLIALLTSLGVKMKDYVDRRQDKMENDRDIDRKKFMNEMIDKLKKRPKKK